MNMVLFLNAGLGSYPKDPPQDPRDYDEHKDIQYIHSMKRRGSIMAFNVITHQIFIEYVSFSFKNALTFLGNEFQAVWQIFSCFVTGDRLQWKFMTIEYFEFLFPFLVTVS